MTDITELAQSEINDALAQLKQISEYPTPSTQYARVLRKYIATLVEALEKAQQRIDELLPSSGNMLMPALEGLSRDHLLVTTQTAVDNYSALHTKWLEDRQRIAELESRTVKLPKPISVLHRREFTGAHCAIYAYPEAEVNAALDDAGIKVEAE